MPPIPIVIRETTKEFEQMKINRICVRQIFSKLD